MRPVLTGVARAGLAFGGGAALPQFNLSDYWAHGVNLGVEAGV